MSEPIRVDLYSRPGCHLCDDAKAAVEQLRQRIPFELNVVNVESNPVLERAYGMEIPVILVNGVRTDLDRFEEKVKRLCNQ